MNIFQSLLKRFTPSVKKLEEGINVEELYAAELLKLYQADTASFEQNKEKFLKLTTQTMLCDFQFEDERMLSIPAFDFYPRCSEEFIRRIFENNEMFEILMQQLNKSDRYDVVKLEKLMGAYEFRKVSEDITTLIRAAHMLYDEKIPKDVRRRLEILEKKYSIKKLLAGKDTKFKFSIEGVEHSIEKKELIQILTENERNFNARLAEGDIEANYVLFKGLEIFLSQGEDYPMLLDKYAFSSEHVRRYERIYNTEMVKLENARRVRNKKTVHSDKYNINPKLRTEVLKDMPQELGDLEKSIYIYRKLCQILVYDSKFFVNDSGPQLLEHSNIMRLNTITPENNAVVCYEFAYIYAKFLEEFSINHEIRFGTQNRQNAFNARSERERKDYGGTTHAFCVVKAEDIIFVADSTTTAFGGDLINAKIGEYLNGFEVLSNEMDKRERFEEADKKIETVLSNQPNLAEQSNLLKTYRGLLENEERSSPIAMEEKLVFLQKLLASAGKSDGLENYYYLSRSYKNIV